MSCAGPVRRQRSGLRQGVHNALHLCFLAHCCVQELRLELQSLWCVAVHSAAACCVMMNPRRLERDSRAVAMPWIGHLHAHICECVGRQLML